MQMSRKAGLAKKIAHTLMAMSIVYSSGINIVINEVYAAERTENITSGGTFRENGADGDSYNYGSPSDSVTSGEDASLTGKITAADVSANPIEIEVKGGVGGRDSGSSPQLMQGTSGGNATAKVTIDESLNSVTTGNISVTAYGGANGSAYQGVAGLAGAAAAYGLEVKHDLSITAADIIVKAENNSDYNTRVDIAAAKGADTLAVGLHADNSTVTLSGGKIKVTAKSSHSVSADNTFGAAKLSAGGNAEAYGIRVNGGEVTATLTGNVEITDSYAGRGGSTSSYLSALVTTGKATDGGDGGNVVAYGVEVSGGTAYLNLQDIKASGIRAGSGGTAAGTDASSVKAGQGGQGGSIAVAGVHVASGRADGSIGNIIFDVDNTSYGGYGGVGKNNIGGDGGDGGNAYAYGVFGTGGSSHTVLAVDQIIAEATAGAAGDGATADGSYHNGVATSGNAGVKGEEAKAYGVYAASGAVVDLSAKTGDTIKINAKAAEGTVTNDAYAVYADKGTVLFGSKAQLNWDGISGTDNNLVTGLNNATLGFSGTSADRTVSGGKLQLTGSNAFRFTTDLANNKADSMTFDTIENNGSKQYIQIGYEEAFKNALSEADIVTINGSATVLTITNLNGQNLNNFTGQASSLDSPLERFRVTPTVDVVDNKINITEIALAKENTPSETAMVASDAQMALGSMWRIEGNNLMKCMGELRSDKEAAEGGVWARYYRGELSADSAYDREFSQDYTAFQGGIDKVQDYKGGKLYTGIAVNRIDSNTGYTAGSGDLSSTGVGVYASWLGGKGHYLDVIARGSKLTNDFKLVDLSGNAAKADYDTWAYGISAEYGYRQQLNAGWFVEPQAELSLGRMGSVDYTTSNDVTIKQDSVNSAVVRLGFLGGKEFTIGGRASNAYVKASLLHDFGGNGGATGYYGSDSLALQTGDLTGTWYEIGLGANLGIAKNSNLYFDALKTFGGDLRTDWQFNAGLRFTF